MNRVEDTDTTTPAALAAAYRDLPDGDAEPPLWLDRQLRAAARAPRRRARWAPPLALAASVTLAVGLALTVQREQSRAPSPTRQTAAPAAAPTERNAVLEIQAETQADMRAADDADADASADAAGAAAPVAPAALQSKSMSDAEFRETPRASSFGDLRSPPSPAAASPADVKRAAAAQRQRLQQDAVAPRRDAAGARRLERDAAPVAVPNAPTAVPNAADFEPLLRLLRDGHTSQAAAALETLLARYPEFPAARLPAPLRRLRQNAETPPR